MRAGKPRDYSILLCIPITPTPCQACHKSAQSLEMYPHQCCPGTRTGLTWAFCSAFAAHP